MPAPSPPGSSRLTSPCCPPGVALHLAEALQLLLFTGLFRQGAEQSKELRAGRGGDVQEEGESLAQRAGGQPGVPNPAGGWATWGVVYRGGLRKRPAGTAWSEAMVAWG